MFICSPNNPTGNLINQDDIVYCCGHFNGIVVVDEAYIDFTTSQDATKWLAQYPNLVVIRTLSKAWGLASLRIGMAFGHPALIDILNRVKPPYNLSGPNQEIALRALQQGYGQQQHLVSQILEQRIWLTDQLNNLPIIEHLYRSDANFILVKFGPSIVAKAVYQYLLGVGIVVRDRSSQAGCANCLRVTVGTADENQKLILALCVYN
jgi:histidinol-phosphate aminotransferase